METLTIHITDEEVSNVQKCDIERCSRRDIITHIIQNGLTVNPERFDTYQKDYDEKYYAFENAKSEIEKKYVLPAVGGRRCDWNLDYNSNTLTITVME